MLIILLSLLLSLLLDIVLFPIEAMFMPEWVLLVSIYWTLEYPEKVGVGWGWIMGFLMDVLKDTPLGLYALCLSCASLFVAVFHQRIRYHPIWQQCLLVLLIAVLFQLLSFWLRGGNVGVHGVGDYLIMPLTSALSWPFVFYGLSHWRRFSHAV